MSDVGWPRECPHCGEKEVWKGGKTTTLSGEKRRVVLCGNNDCGYYDTVRGWKRRMSK